MVMPYSIIGNTSDFGSEITGSSPVRVTIHNFLYGGAYKLNINFKICCKMAKHDENKDLKSFSRIGKVSLGDKTLRASKNATIGIHMWGKIDFLTHYCGWHFIWDNSAGVGMTKSDDNANSYYTDKKAKKEHQLTDKTKKSKKK